MTQEIKDAPQRYVAGKYLDEAEKAAFAAESAISHLRWSHCLAENSDEYHALYDLVIRLKKKIRSTRQMLLGETE